MAPSAGVIPHTALTSTPAVLWDEGSCGGALGPLVSGVAMALVLRNVTAQASGLNLFPSATQVRMESFPAMKDEASSPTFPILYSLFEPMGWQPCDYTEQSNSGSSEDRLTPLLSIVFRGDRPEVKGHSYSRWLALLLRPLAVIRT